MNLRHPKARTVALDGADALVEHVQALGWRVVDDWADAAVAVVDDRVADSPSALREWRGRAPLLPRLLVVDADDPTWVERCASAREVVPHGDPVSLSNTLERLAGYRPSERPDVSALVDVDVWLPVYPSVIHTLDAVLADPRASFAECEQVLLGEPALVAAIFRLINSGFFGLPRRVVSLNHALSLLGTNWVRTLAIAASVFGSAASSRCTELARRRGLAAMSLFRAIDGGHGDAMLVGAVLSSVGMVVLEHALGGDYHAMLDIAERSGRSVRALEGEHLGMTHATVGGALLEAWGLPAPVCAAVAQAHTRFPQPTHGFGSDVALYATCAICEEVETDRPSDLLDATWLRALRLEQCVWDWRETAGDSSLRALAA